MRCQHPSLLASIALLSAAMFMPLPQEWSVGWRGELLNRLHTPLFALVGLVLPFRRVWVAFLMTTAVAALVEVTQPWFGRSASMQDFYWGLMGAAGAALWQARSLLLKATALIMTLAPPGVHAAKVTMARMEAARQFPVLFTAQSQQNTMLWQMSHLAQKTSNGFTLRQGSSIRLEVTESDWRNFEALELTGTLDSLHTLELGVRLDLGGPPPNRIHTHTTFEPGPNRLRVPWPKKARLSPVKQVVLFLSTTKGPSRLRLEDIRVAPVTKK